MWVPWERTQQPPAAPAKGMQPFLLGVKLEPKPVFRAKSFAEATMK